ncbi:MAG: FAD-dependent oxidoreductase, partial [Blastocatellia bacterium]
MSGRGSGFFAPGWAALAVLALSGAIYGQGPLTPEEARRQAGYDVVVVGSGIAGVAGALEASARGARVAVLDMNSMPGGHAIQSSAGILIAGSDLQRRFGIEDDVEQAFEDWMRYGEDGDAAWARHYLENCVT